MTDRFVNVDRAGNGVDVTILGLGDVEKALRAFDPELTRELNRSIRAVLNPIRDAARGKVPDVALSGWDDTGQGEWSTRLGWDASAVRKGIKVRKGGSRASRSRAASTGVSVAWRLVNESAAGAVFELAGRRSTNRLASSLRNAGHGAASRLIWDAYDDRKSTIEPAIRAAVETAERHLDRLANPSGVA